MQQIGGSLGTAVFSRVGAGATTSALAGKPATAGAVATATVPGYTTAFWWVGGSHLRRRRRSPPRPTIPARSTGRSAPREPVGAGQPDSDPADGHEAADGDRRAAITLEERGAPAECSESRPASGPAGEQRSAAEPSAEHIADVVADDRSERGERRDGSDLHVPVGGEHRCCDEPREFAGVPVGCSA